MGVDRSPHDAGHATFKGKRDKGPRTVESGDRGQSAGIRMTSGADGEHSVDRI